MKANVETAVPKLTKIESMHVALKEFGLAVDLFENFKSVSSKLNEVDLVVKTDEEGKMICLELKFEFRGKTQHSDVALLEYNVEDNSWKLNARRFIVGVEGGTSTTVVKMKDVTGIRTTDGLSDKPFIEFYKDIGINNSNEATVRFFGTSSALVTV